MFKKLTRRKILSIEETKDLLERIKGCGLTFITIGKGGEYTSLNEFKIKVPDHPLCQFVIIQLKVTKLEITTRYLDGKPCTYICDLNEEESFSSSGQRCFTEFSKYFKVIRCKNNEDYSFLDNFYDEEQGKYVCSASPLVGFNKTYNNQELTDCYEYDLNSAYASVLLNKIPDLEHPIFKPYSHVEKGEIGFLLDNTLTLTTNVGDPADVRFKLIDTPEKLKEFLIKYYIKKQESEGVDKLEAKAMLNLPIGYCQRYNPFLRAYVVNTCNKVIRDLIDKNTLFWNTDAIFSKVKRTDLKIGNEIGEFKEIHCDSLRYIDNTYQVNNELPKFRGIPKSWFKKFEEIKGRPFNILLDKTPEKGNKWSFNWNKLKLEELDYGKIN